MKDKVTEVMLYCPCPMKVMHILLIGAWVALYVCARVMVGRCLLLGEESATSCMSSLLTPILRLVSTFLSFSTHFAIHA